MVVVDGGGGAGVIAVVCGCVAIIDAEVIEDNGNELESFENM